MAKAKFVYVCNSCQHEMGHWVGNCPSCKQFNSLQKTELADREVAGLKNSGPIRPTKPALSLSEVKATRLERFATGIDELDRVLGGGFVDGEVILFAGEPGSGKSTLSLEVANRYAKAGKTVLYSSGEESREQIGLRANRMSVTSDLIKVINETNLEKLLGYIESENPDLVIVDSLQTLASDAIVGSIGSVSQGKEAAHTLTLTAKRDGIAMIFIGQVVKTGEFAGSESVQHIVDCALRLESDRESPFKFLRTTKNRFGDLNEVGVFQHTETGLEEVPDPSGVFMEANHQPDTTGSALSFVSEGIRQIPIEVQALVTQSSLPTPRKQFNGIHHQRGQMICAILDKFAKLQSFQKDVFVSTVAGIRVNDPQSDLATAMAILSSNLDKAVKEKTVFIGELSLTGQVRGGFMIVQKLKEAHRLGFEHAVIPVLSKGRTREVKDIPIKLHFVNNAKELTKFLQ